METLIKLAFTALEIAIKQLQALGVSDEKISEASSRFVAKVDATTKTDHDGDVSAMQD